MAVPLGLVAIVHIVDISPYCGHIEDDLHALSRRSRHPDIAGGQPFTENYVAVVKAADDGEFVQSLARGLRVLQSFGAAKSSMTLTEVAERTDLTRGTARRLLLTLDRLGFVGSDGKQFWLKPQVMDLGYRYLASLPWWQLAKPIIEEATSAVNEACNVGILDGVDIIYTAGVEVNRIVSTNIRIGSRLPAHATATGRVLLSLLSDQQLDNFFNTAELKQLTPKTVVDEATLRSILRKVRVDQYLSGRPGA